MRIIAKYIDKKYQLNVVVENSTTSEIHWWIHYPIESLLRYYNDKKIYDVELPAGMICDNIPGSNGIDLENKKIHLNKIAIYITGPQHHLPQYIE